MISKNKKLYIAVISGPMGAGKTTVSELIHKKTKKVALISGDKTKWIISDFKRSKRDNEIKSTVVRGMIQSFITEGVSVILDQGMMNDGLDDLLKNLHRKYNVKIFLYAIEAPKSVLLERLKKRPTREEAHKPVPYSRILKNLERYESRKIKNAKQFDSSLISSEKIAKEVLKDLS